jgi:threonine aldolase
VIDLRSDTATLPSRGMRDAMATADVGDDQKREDPTVLELERRVAELLGKDEAVYLPTATMANQIALRILTEPGDELLPENAHLLRAGRPRAFRARHAPDGRPGALTGVQPDARPYVDAHVADAFVAIGTRNSSGGRCWRMEEVDDLVTTARGSTSCF